jgi:hypothetical protein
MFGRNRNRATNRRGRSRRSTRALPIYCFDYYSTRTHISGRFCPDGAPWCGPPKHILLSPRACWSMPA